MTRLRPEDLPKAARERLERQLGVKLAKSSPAKSRAGVGDAQPCAGRCSCGESFPNAAAWERHCTAAGVAGHSVWTIDLT